MNEKRKKEAFVGVRRVKIGENRLSPVRENQKSAKIGFPPRGKIKNRRKSTFRHGGKQEITENWLSLTGENQKTTKIGFPNIGKTKNWRKTAFPILGRIKNAIGCISQLSERRKTPKVFYLTFGVRFILTHPHNISFSYHSQNNTLYLRIIYAMIMYHLACIISHEMDFDKIPKVLLYRL